MNLFEKYRPLYAPEDGQSSSPSGGSGGDAPASSPSPVSVAVDGSGGESAGASPPVSSPDKGGDGLDFTAIFGSDGSGTPDGVPEVPPAIPAAAAPTPPVAAPPGAKPESVPPQGVEVQPPVVAAAPVAPDQGQPQPVAAEAATVDPYDPAGLANHLATNEAQAVELVAQKLFQLSNEEREALEQDVIGTIPTLLAKVFVKSQQNVLQQLGNLIPTMVQRQLGSIQSNGQNENKFFDRWKDLDRAKHVEIARKYAAVYRQMHPKATLHQMIEDLGPMVMMAARVAPSVGGPEVVVGQAAGGQPGAPLRTPNGRAPQPSPFAPAGAGPATQGRPQELEAWEAMFSQQS